MNIAIAFIKKEFLQIIRDPSSLIIAFILPILLLLIYTYGLNMDDVSIRLGVKNDDINPQTTQLVKAFSQNKYVTMTAYDNKESMYNDMVRNKITGALIIPNNFTRTLESGKNPSLLLITDGSEYNQVGFTQNYVNAIVGDWFKQSNYPKTISPVRIRLEPRIWYNQAMNGVWSIVPASLAVTMTLIGILLTALVIAREWERGTMETLLSTNIRPIHIVVGKYVPYFIIGMLSLAFNVLVMILILDIPFRGNIFILLGVSSLFLYACLGIGLIISSLLKNQFLASMASLLVGFLPAFMLSGLVFPIKSMPLFFQYITLILPPRYYVEFVRSEFLSGTEPSVVLHSATYLFVLGFFFSVLVYRKTARRIDV